METVLTRAPVIYTPDSIGRITASIAFKTLREELAWVRRQSVMKTAEGEEVINKVPRSEYWTNVYDRPYTYGRGAGIRTYEAQPAHPLIDQMRDGIASVCGDVLEGCFLNLYLDGSDALGWHADDDPAINHAKPIAVVTLGEGRPIQFKSKEPGSHPQEQFLEHGSLLLMLPGMQETHFHRIPKVGRQIGERISLTFRGLFA